MRRSIGSTRNQFSYECVRRGDVRYGKGQMKHTKQNHKAIFRHGLVLDGAERGSLDRGVDVDSVV